MLRAQSRNGIEIVNNADFLEWTDSGYEDCAICTKYYPAPPQEQPEYILEAFMPAELGRDPADEIRSVDDLEEVVPALWKYRAEFGLEDVPASVTGWRVYPESEYEMCSTETKTTEAQTYIEYNLRYNGNYHYLDCAMYCPLLGKIADWLDSQ